MDVAERAIHTVRKTAASRSRDASKKRFKSEEGWRDLACSWYERAQAMRLEMKEILAAATDTLLRRAGPWWVAQSAMRTSWRAARQPVTDCRAEKGGGGNEFLFWCLHKSFSGG
jgi:hypothetical protein